MQVLVFVMLQRRAARPCIGSWRAISDDLQSWPRCGEIQPRGIKWEAQMLTLKQVGSALLAVLFVTAITLDDADARRGGGGGGGGHRGGHHGGHRGGHIGGARPSHPIAGGGNRLANI